MDNSVQRVIYVFATLHDATVIIKLAKIKKLIFRVVDSRQMLTSRNPISKREKNKTPLYSDSMATSCDHCRHCIFSDIRIKHMLNFSLCLHLL